MNDIKKKFEKPYLGVSPCDRIDLKLTTYEDYHDDATRELFNNYIRGRESMHPEIDELKVNRDDYKKMYINSQQQVKEIADETARKANELFDLENKVNKLRKALEKAEEFIENGIEYGYIIMPEPGDTALDTLPMIKQALKE